MTGVLRPTQYQNHRDKRAQNQDHRADTERMPGAENRDNGQEPGL